ncbi:MAG: ABC transporter permease [Bacillota bacterium]|nr:ABC transporter permease [Bacillota bacterium]
MFTIILGILEQGLIFGIIALGVLITYKILDFPDLTVDGSYPLGAAITAALVIRGYSPFLALLLSLAAGALAGVVTGLIHVKCKVRDLLSGIITMTALYSINLHIAGSANVPIFQSTTIFNHPLTTGIFRGPFNGYKILLGIAVITILAKILMDLYLKTRSGYLLQAVGNNDVVVTSLAKNKGTVKILGLAIANGLVALAGSIMCQQQRYFEITMGTGTIVIGLAAVIIGLSLFRKVSFVKATTAVIIGSILYKACIAIAIACGMPAIDMKLITAALFLVILVVSMERRKRVKPC